MNLWRFTDPFDHRFAQASRVGGVWQEGEYRERMRPLVVEWEPGSDLVGDFTWPGLDTDIVVSDRVGRALINCHIKGFELRHIEAVRSCRK